MGTSVLGITIDSIQMEGIACFELAAAIPGLQRLSGNSVPAISMKCNQFFSAVLYYHFNYLMVINI